MQEKLVKRTIWVIRCECGFQKEWLEKPPREFQCKCKKWLKPEEITYVGKEIGEGQ